VWRATAEGRVAPKVRDSTAQGATLGLVMAQMRSPERASLRSSARRHSPRDMPIRESRPVGAENFIAGMYPGFRCAPPWAMESDPFGVDGYVPLPASSRAAGLDGVQAEGRVAPKVRDSTAQGATLGLVATENAVALKGRHSDRPHDAIHLATCRFGNRAPLGLTISSRACTQGSAALHPGLWNLTPSGSTIASLSPHSPARLAWMVSRARACSWHAFARMP
jgi:hypothetical protein